jgi:hypothetical protein
LVFDEDIEEYEHNEFLTLRSHVDWRDEAVTEIKD